MDNTILLEMINWQKLQPTIQQKILPRRND